MTPTQGEHAQPKSTAADGKTELFNFPGHPLMVRAVDFNRLHAYTQELESQVIVDCMSHNAQPAAPQGVAEAPKVYLSVNQLLQAIEFATGGAPANADELETSIGFQIGHSQDDDGKVIHGMRCWLADYPEEGAYPLDEEPTAKDLAAHALRASNGQATAGATDDQRELLEDAAFLLRKYRRLCVEICRGDSQHLDRVEAAAVAVRALYADPAPTAQPAIAGAAGWQDISTAPKDGTRFAAVGQNYGLYSETQHTCIAQWFQGCWMEASDWNETSELKYLTHWMPLLPLPAPTAQAAPAAGAVAGIKDWAAGARFALEQVAKIDHICWLTDSMREIGITQAGKAVLAERDRMLAAAPTPAAQAQAGAVPLTAEQIERIHQRYGGNMTNCVRAIERHHGITAHGAADMKGGQDESSSPSVQSQA